VFKLVPDELATDEAVSDKLAGASEVKYKLRWRELIFFTII